MHTQLLVILQRLLYSGPPVKAKLISLIPQLNWILGIFSFLFGMLLQHQCTKCLLKTGEKEAHCPKCLVLGPVDDCWRQTQCPRGELMDRRQNSRAQQKVPNDLHRPQTVLLIHCDDARRRHFLRTYSASLLPLLPPPPLRLHLLPARPP